MKTFFQKCPLLLALLLLLACLGACTQRQADMALQAADELISLLEEDEAEPSPTAAPSSSPAAQQETPAVQSPELPDEDGVYTAKDELALYLHTYGHLPSNFITKSQARDAGWNGGALEPYCPGKCIGGDRFGNREGMLPSAKGRTWYECDVNTLGARSRGAERLVYSSDGLIYYTGDHYESYELLYGDPG